MVWDVLNKQDGWTEFVKDNKCNVVFIWHSRVVALAKNADILELALYL